MLNLCMRAAIGLALLTLISIIVHRDLPAQGRFRYVWPRACPRNTVAKPERNSNRVAFTLQPPGSRRTRALSRSSSRSAARSTSTPLFSRTPTRLRSSRLPSLLVRAPRPRISDPEKEMDKAEKDSCENDGTDMRDYSPHHRRRCQAQQEADCLNFLTMRK